MFKQVEFEAITYRGDKRTFVKSIECPDFTVKKGKKVEIMGKKIQLNDTSIEEQCDDWISNHYDLRGLMHSEDLCSIVNWKVLSSDESSKTPEARALMVLDHLFEDTNDKLKADFLAAYDTMRVSIEDLPIRKQIYIVLNGMDLGYRAAEVAYGRISKILKGENPDDLNDHTRENLLGA